MLRRLLPVLCLLSLWGAPLHRTDAAPRGRGQDPGPTGDLALPSQEALAAAERHHQQGAAAYQERSYKIALREFLLAYGLSRAPDLLVKAAAASEGLRNIEESILLLKRYLQESPGARDQLDVLAEIEWLGKLKVAPPDPTGEAPQPAVKKTAPPPERPGRGLLFAGVGLGVSGAVLLITGLSLNGAALSVSRQLESAPRFDADLFGRGRALDAAGVTADVIGGAALLAGSVLGVMWYRRKTAPEDTRLVVLPAGPGVAVAGRF